MSNRITIFVYNKLIMKTCLKCNIQKPLNDFTKRSDTPSGYKGKCKICINIESREKYRLKNGIPEITEGKRLCKECNIIKDESEFKENLNREDKLQIRCSTCFELYIANKKERAVLKRLENGREYYRLKDLRYRNKHRERVRTKRRENQKLKRDTDILYNLKHGLSSSLNQYLRSTKSKKTLDILGCTIEEFKNHIESQFLPWMNWSNRGRNTTDYNTTWQLDHIIPMSTAETEEEVYLLNHWSNFQPLCSKVNLEKTGIVLPVTNLELKITKIN